MEKIKLEICHNCRNTEEVLDLQEKLKNGIDIYFDYIAGEIVSKDVQNIKKPRFTRIDDYNHDDDMKKLLSMDISEIRSC